VKPFLRKKSFTKRNKRKLSLGKKVLSKNKKEKKNG